MKLFSLTVSFAQNLIDIIKTFFQGEVEKMGLAAIGVYPSKNMVWFPAPRMITSEFVFKILHFLCHFVPAAIVDIILYFKGSKLNMKSICTKVYLHADLYRYFIENNRKFNDLNMKEVCSRMSKDDLEYFPMKIPGRSAAEKYAVDFANGLRKFVLKETDEDLVEARKKYKILKLIYYLLWSAIYSAIGYFIYCKVNQSFKFSTWIHEN